MKKYFPLTKEEMLVVHVAAFVCRNIGFPKPSKNQVLNLVRDRKLMRFYDDDQSLRKNGEPKWRNDLAYAREDLTRVGYMKYAETDQWELSELGVSKITEWSIKLVSAVSSDPSELERLLTQTKRFSSMLLDYLGRIAKGESLERTPQEKII